MSLLFRPVEQTVSRAVADQVARGLDARPAVRSAAWLALGLTLLAVGALAAAWVPLTDGLFGGRDVLTAFIAGYEVECRLGEMSGPKHYDLGYHATGTFGTRYVFGDIEQRELSLEMRAEWTFSPTLTLLSPASSSRSRGRRSRRSPGSRTRAGRAGRSRAAPYWEA